MADGRSDEASSDFVDSVRFTFYTPEEVRRISVKKITKPDLFDAKDAPIVDGLYDPALGPLDKIDSCKTCGQLSVRCPGHYGHIDFGKPLYHPLLFANLKGLLQVTCFHCHRFRFKEERVEKYALQLQLIIKGNPVVAKNFDEQPVSTKKMKKKLAALDMDSKNLTQQKWTSLQQSEALLVLSKFLAKNSKMCQNCKKRNPTITSPVFGWFNKTISEEAIRANFIIDSNHSLASTEVDEPKCLLDRETQDEDSFSEGGVSLIDEELPVPAKKRRNTKLKSKELLPPDFTKLLESSGRKHLLPSEVEFILEALWEKEKVFCGLLCDIQEGGLNSSSEKAHTMFLLKALLVPPNKFRPPAGDGTGKVLEHPQNVLLMKVQEANIALCKLIAESPDNPNIVKKWMDLQQTVNVLFDSSKALGKSDRETSGIRQLLEKKSGILRQKMMGKRVNHACRTVISPDPYLAVNEIGIPPNFALRLTYPVRVTPWNVDELRAAVINGADLHPGATHYKDKDRMYKLQVTRNHRMAIARKLPTSRASAQTGKGPETDFEGKIVNVHLRNGDVVLVNRQPTLHKPSMMAHIVRVLPELKTFRMHYANCSTYNADFDGDEMNVHLPQDEVSRAEAFGIVDANKQYIVPTSGDPIRGLIQDHIVSAVLLTRKDMFLTRDEYNQLLYACCVPIAASSSQVSKFGEKVTVLCSSNEIQPLFPAILKPKPLWTGKQVISSILNYVTRGRKPFTVEKDGRIPKEYFGKDLTEHKLFILNNELIHGMIDKAQFGKHGLVHTVHEFYGADTAGILLSMFSRLFTIFLQIHGFTCGVDDLLICEDSDLRRKDILETSEKESEQVHLQFTNNNSVDLQKEIEKVIRTNVEPETARLDRMMSSKMNAITSEANNALFPTGLVKSFPANCLSLMTVTGAKGGLVNMTQISSLLGQQELEGKRVPRMVSGKTLPCFPPWDISSRAGGFISDRFLTGLRPQEYYFHCMAGREGLVDTAIKTSRSGYLQRCLVKNLECLKVSYDYTVRDADGSVVQFMYGEDGVDVLKTSFLTEFGVLASNKSILLDRPSDQDLYKSNAFICELPETLKEKATTFIHNLSKKGLHKIEKKELLKLLKVKYFSSLADPGEPVGVVAAQSIGEPSTQMTLNTFHLAGRGDMNVTLGIPRLQEILMTAKEEIRTPIMTCPLLHHIEKEDAEDLAATLRKITIADIVENMEVFTVPLYIHNQKASIMYRLKMKLHHPDLLNRKLFHSDDYRAKFGVTLDAYEQTLRVSFVKALEVAIFRHLDLVYKIGDISDVSRKDESINDEQEDADESESKAGQTKDNDDAGDGSDAGDEIAEDQGADAEKRKRQVCDEMEYEDDAEKVSSPRALEDHDEEATSGLEDDQAEAEDEDYVIGGKPLNSDTDDEDNVSGGKPLNSDADDEDDATGGKPLNSEADLEALGSPSNFEVPVSETVEDESTEKRKTRRRPNREAKRVIRTKYHKLKFELLIVFQEEDPHILLAEVAQQAAKKVLLKDVKNIERCTVIERKKPTDPYSLQTAGVNFSVFWDLNEHLNLAQVQSNDIHAMLTAYGVEAAKSTIINEVKGVFGAYGIHVNHRHLSLIADFMTLPGWYRPMNRLGMDKFCTSPFGKMTFETATKFIVQAALHGEVDYLEAPSASVSLGQPMKMGTGCFDLLQNLHV
ncbi:DNA-directed RNA polymerase protein [Dioscorea alata]|uniref:DNA-directed RNA polymerase protein n=1 Tax=Dioscorea alata TaxID=55571 RepID=A0ACB7W9L0_DIOAL|nr:DNA-directed RNA polymerase protein [Dioscorea alata]